jgi:cyclophilin family peptidyl-prolyl cis-trans isomerase/HEAT repeat protein
MIRNSLPVLPLILLLVLFGCRSDSAATEASSPESGKTTATDPADTVIRVIEQLEAARDLGEGKLVRYLSDPDARVRARAALAIGRIGDRDALLSLAPRFRDSAAPVRATALLAAAINRDDRFLSEAGRALEDSDALVRQRGVEMLGRVESPRSTDRVLGALKDPDLGVSCAAADALFKIRDARAIEPLTASLQAGPSLLRFHAANALERFLAPRHDPISGQPRAIEPEIVAAMKVAEPALLEAAVGSDTRVAAAALRALGWRSWIISDIAPLKQALGSPDPGVVAAALLALRPQMDEEAVQAHVTNLGHKNAHVRWEAVKGLGSMHEVVKAAGEGAMRDRVADRVKVVLDADAEMQIRSDALVTLALLRGAAILEDAKDYLEHADNRMRSGLARAAGLVGGTRALAILRRLSTDKDIRVRTAAMQGLGTLGGEAAAQRLYRGLEDRSTSVRAQAAEVLRDLGDQKAVDALRRAYKESLDHPTVASGEARLRILQALANVGGRRKAAGALNEALGDPSILVRNGVVEMLEVMNGYRPEVTFTPGTDQPIRPEVENLNPDVQPSVILYTNKGEIRLELYPDVAPATVRTFLSLVQTGFYREKTFHRVVAHHVVQGGDPEGTGYGALDFTVPDEPSGEPFKAGAVGLAKLGKDTGSCQLFITLEERPHLNQEYTLFGRVQQGMGVVRRLMPGDRITKASWVKELPARSEPAKTDTGK